MSSLRSHVQPHVLPDLLDQYASGVLHVLPDLDQLDLGFLHDPPDLYLHLDHNNLHTHVHVNVLVTFYAWAHTKPILCTHAHAPRFSFLS